MKVERFSLSLSRPLATAHGTIDAREGFLVEIEDGDTTGVGEATPLQGWTESLEACEDALSRARVASVDGWDAALTELDGTPAARHGLALALGDARSRRANAPLYRHLGGTPTEVVPVNATIGDATVETTVEEALAAVASGFEALKLKVGARALDTDADRLLAVREAVGHDVELRADANGSWDEPTARAAISALEDADLAYLEQPLPADDVAGHAALRGEVPLALDESLATHSVEELVDADAADFLVVKPMVVGGPDRAHEAALAAREAGLEAVLSTTIDGALARAGALHVAASLDRPAAAGLATADRFAEDLIPDPAPIVDGHARVPQQSGNAPTPKEILS